MSGWTVDAAFYSRDNWAPLRSWNDLHCRPNPDNDCLEPNFLTGFYDYAVHTYFDNARQEVIDRHIQGMYDAKFNFAVFQVGWNRPAGSPGPGWPFWTHAVSRYLTSPYKNLLQFAVLWDEEDDTPASVPRWRNRYDSTKVYPNWHNSDYRNDIAQMVSYWRDNYMQDPNYLRIDGKPVLYILADLWTPYDSVFRYDASADASPTSVISLIRQTMASAGLQVYIVGFAAKPEEPARVDTLKATGFDAVTGYQYRGTNGWAARANQYASAWTTFANRARTQGLTYFPVTTTGFDNRPLSHPDPFAFVGVLEAHSTSDQYEQHVIAAKNFNTNNSDVTRGYVMNCCWNEWTEGAVLERTSDISYQKGTDHADAHMRVYGGIAPGTHRRPYGWIDGIVNNYVLYGWALDDDTPSQMVSLNIYIGTGPGGGCGAPNVYVGGPSTDQQRDDVNAAYNVLGTHGWQFAIPAQYRDGQPHKLCAWAFDTGGNASLVSQLYPGEYTFVANP
ncbi:MAG: glycoside hydrolase family 99-like domain-containing protein [Gemmatimonadota bacterium]|nr:glycoside hydrolase family 99-like domain-containing protein [Gemmatimonadota bacterium]